jgi:ribosomal protein S11
MFLLHIEKNKIKKDNLLQITQIKNLTKKIKNKIFFFKKLKKKENLKNLRFLISKTDVFESYGFERNNSLIKYVIGISMYNTNTIIYLSDIKGTIKFFCSAGSLKMNKKQKTKKISVLIKLMKFMLSKINFVSRTDLIALHLKNFNKHLSFFALNFLLKYRDIGVLKINNNPPHNGCRPRKLKRKKRQRLNFETKRDFEGMTERFKVTNCKFVGFFPS